MSKPLAAPPNEFPSHIQHNLSEIESVKRQIKPPAEVAAPLPEPHPLRKIFEDGGATVHEDVYAPPSAFVSPLPEPTEDEVTTFLKTQRRQILDIERAS